MKKGIWILGMTAILMFGMTSTVYAAGSVEFTNQNELKLSDTNFGTEFNNMAPGETTSQTVTISNRNSNTADFYVNTEALLELEKANQASGGTYEIKLEIKKGGTVTPLYDSSLGGAATGDNGAIVADKTGILKLNSSEIGSETTFLTTLGSGESADLILTIGLDGESIRNAEQNTYRDAKGILGMEFLVAYREPATGKIVTVDRVVTKSTEPMKNVVQTFKQVVVGVKTGDQTMIGAMAGIIIVGIVLIILTGKRKKSGESL